MLTYLYCKHLLATSMTSMSSLKSKKTTTTVHQPRLLTPQTVWQEDMQVINCFIIDSNGSKTCKNALINACIKIRSFKPNTSLSVLLDHAEKCFHLHDQKRLWCWAIDVKKADTRLLKWIVDHAVSNYYFYYSHDPNMLWASTYGSEATNILSISPISQSQWLATLLPGRSWASSQLVLSPMY